MALIDKWKNKINDIDSLEREGKLDEINQYTS